jgi:hypothetical protein
MPVGLGRSPKPTPDGSRSRSGLLRVAKEPDPLRFGHSADSLSARRAAGGSNGSGSAFDRDVCGAQQHGPLGDAQVGDAG